MHLRWNDYPTISYYKKENFDIIEMDSPSLGKVLKEVENLGEDQALVLKNANFLPEDSRSYMKKHSELKIPLKKVSPWSHFPEHFGRIRKNKPKRGYKWQNKRSNTSIFVPFHSIIDGTKNFMAHRNYTEVKFYSSGPDNVITGEVKSRSSKKKYRVFQTAVLSEDPTSWRFYKSGCGCGSHQFGKYTTTKYVNPENYVCSHHVEFYNLAMEKESDIRPLFPWPTKKFSAFDENSTRVFEKRFWNKRLTLAQRNVLDSAYIGLLNERNEEGLSFWRNDAVMTYEPLAKD